MSAPVAQDPLDRAPAMKMINEANKRIGMLEVFSPNKIQVQTLKIELESAREVFQAGDYRVTEKVILLR